MSSLSSAPASTTPVGQLRARGRGRLVDRLTWGVAVANLIAQIGIIVTGGAVRLTGSGLGCSEWPVCEPGAFTPQFHAAMTFHPIIEFGNRMLGVVVGVIALAMLVAVYRREPTSSRSPAVKRLAWLILIGVGLQGFIGGITVWVDLHPAIVGSHMLISLALVAVSTYLLVCLRSPDGQAVPVSSPSARVLGLAMSTVGVLLLVLGVVTTGAGPHSGDATEPYRWALDPAFVSRLHALAVWVFVGLVVVGLLLARREQNQRAVRAWGWLLAITLAQGAVGYVQYFTGLPELLVGIHMLGSALTVVTLVFAVSSLSTREPAPSSRLTPYDDTLAALAAVGQTTTGVHAEDALTTDTPTVDSRPAGPAE
ncbi:heme A synthase [Dietzia sp. WMMA184]|uniref:COX15/CtaA family protein n=1 Tax=Dietzia sp. WMMA184 TaxID=2039808 RepID=UPI000BDED854|nr:COX15/CtaA family protein [Dietzia sp. WMMA184]